MATALVCADLEYDEDDVVLHEARKRIKTAVDGSLVKDQVNDDVFISNPPASEFVTRWSRHDALVGEVQAWRTENQTTRNENQEIRATQVRLLDEDKSGIRAGNALAHEGDVDRDAGLYDQGGRNDLDAFRRLYGFAPATVLEKIHRKFYPNIMVLRSTDLDSTERSRHRIKSARNYLLRR